MPNLGSEFFKTLGGPFLRRRHHLVVEVGADDRINLADELRSIVYALEKNKMLPGEGYSEGRVSGYRYVYSEDAEVNHDKYIDMLTNYLDQLGKEDEESHD